MKKLKEIGVGVLGFGTVGAGVVEGLLKNGPLISDRTGVRLALRRIADLDLERDRGVEVDRSILTTDAQAVVDDPSIQVVVELIGGTGIARALTLRALRNGKSVVTANKALLAVHGSEIYAAAEENKADLYYEASVGGGIPIIRSLREGLIVNRIERIHGILNGTCNYILTRMEREQLPFDQALKAAQEAGFAEAEPSFDIDGIDTAHKAVVLASLAYGFPVAMSELHVEGIRNLSLTDIRLARELGYAIKLLAVVKDSPEGVEIRVHPTLIPGGHLLASVHREFNAIQVGGDVVGQTLYYGRGAGRAPTASAVIGDIVDVARNILHGSTGRVPAFLHHNKAGRIRPMADVTSRYYLRLALLDEPGVLGRVASVLGRHHISISSLMQDERLGKGLVPVVILTHRAREADLDAALQEINALREEGSRVVKLRIEDFDD